MKTLRVTDELWQRLMTMKIDLKKRSIAEVLEFLLYEKPKI